jgi:hypothetical protein
MEPGLPDLDSIRLIVAERGGRVAGEQDGGRSFTGILCAQGHNFFLPFPLLRAGHWCPLCKAERIEREFRETLRESGANMRGKYISEAAAVKVLCRQGHKSTACPRHTICTGFLCPQCAPPPDRLKLIRAVLDGEISLSLPREEIYSRMEARGIPRPLLHETTLADLANESFARLGARHRQ